MSIKIKTLFLYFYLLLNLVGYCQTKNEDGKILKKYPEAWYVQDLNELASTLIETHPQPFKFTSKEAFLALLEEKKNAIDETTNYGKFIWMCSEIIANVGCGHTNLGFFNQEFHALPDSLRFPMNVRMVENRFYVTDPLANADKVIAGNEIFSINGVSMQTIAAGIYKHIASDGHSKGIKKKHLNIEFNSYVPYYFGFPDSYEVLIKNRQQPIQLKPIKKYDWNPQNGYGNPCKEQLCYEINEIKKYAILSVRSFAFYGDKAPIFKRFIDESFEDIRAKGIENLIIDVRGNGGGPSTTTSYLLRHFADKPYTYFTPNTPYGEDFKKPMLPFPTAFTGNTYILMDNGGFSATGLFLSLVQQNEFAVLIGEENGSTYTCNDNSERFTLTHTGISFKVARSTFTTTAKNLRDDQGILPDHYVVQSIHDFLKGTDTVLDYAIDLIDNE
ncbi:MAG: S41 family peptidase [Bacteroidota bacterium]